MADLGMRETYDKMMATIDEIDVQLDSLSGSKASGKRKIVKDLMEKHSDVWADPTRQIVEFIQGQNQEVQAAVVSALQNELRNNFDKSTSAYVEALVDSAPKQEALVTPEEAAALSTNRSALYQKVKAIVDIAETLDLGTWEMPKMRRGSVGERGPRNLSLFTWYINDEEVDMTIGQIAKAHGYEKAAELTKALREAGFDTKDGSELESFTLPDGSVLSGVRDDSEEEEESEEGDE